MITFKKDFENWRTRKNIKNTYKVLISGKEIAIIDYSIIERKYIFNGIYYHYLSEAKKKAREYYNIQ